MKTITILAALLLAACGGGSDESPEVFDDLVETQDRAQAVEAELERHKQELDAALEAAEGANDTPERRPE